MCPSRSSRATNTFLNRQNLHTHLSVAQSHIYLARSTGASNTPFWTVWNYIHFSWLSSLKYTYPGQLELQTHISWLSEPTYTSLGHLSPHAPLSIVLIMHAPLFSIMSCTHLSLGRHVFLSLSCRSMHTPLLVIWSHVLSLGQPDPQTPFSVIRPRINLPSFIFGPINTHLSSIRPKDTLSSHMSPCTPLMDSRSNVHLSRLIFIHAYTSLGYSIEHICIYPC
jgi:hypothetical protein